MDGRRGRIARVGFCVGWFLVLGLALRNGATAPGSGPEQLIPLLVAGYLAAWGPFLLLTRLGPIGRASRFAVCSGSIAVGWLVFEAPAIVGLIDYRAVFQTPSPAWKRPGNRPDPDLLYVRQGHRRDHLTFRGADVHRLRGASAGTIYETDLVTDRDGFRNPVDLPRAEVVILGDSFIEGLQVAAPDLVSARLSEQIGQTVANLGRTGYGPQQEMHVLRKHGVKLHPRTCVWAFYEGNDLQDVAIYDAERSRASQAAARPEPLSRAWYGRSLVRNGLAWLIRTRFQPEPTRPANRLVGRIGERSGRPSEIYFSCDVHEENALPAGRGESVEMKRFQSILAEAHALCDERGIDLVVAFIPAKFRVYRDLCTFPPDSLCRSWPIDDLPRAMEQAVRSVSPEVGFLDLTPLFRADAAAGSLPYLPDDTHWSAQGHQTAARAIGDLLATRPDRPSPRPEGRIARSEAADRR